MVGKPDAVTAIAAVLLPIITLSELADDAHILSTYREHGFTLTHKEQAILKAYREHGYAAAFLVTAIGAWTNGFDGGFGD